MNASLKIYLLYTNYHSLLWEPIIQESTNINSITINLSKRKLKKKYGTIIERSENGKLKFILLCLKVAILAKIKKYELYLPHPDHLLGNNLFFNKNATNITLIEDGILNYYENRIESSKNRSSKLAKKLSIITPFKYKEYTGHLSGIDAKPPHSLDGLFIEPESVVRPEQFSNLTKIPLPNIEEYKSPGIEILLIDQPIEKFLTEELAKNLREKTLELLNSKSRVLIKPHPESTNTNTVHTIKNATIFKNTNITAEELILSTRPRTIISYCSTSLLNAARLLPNSEIISIGMLEIEKELPETRHITRIFKEKNITLL